jgi:DNA-binding IclR family transcriptional regulator
VKETVAVSPVPLHAPLTEEISRQLTSPVLRTLVRQSGIIRHVAVLHSDEVVLIDTAEGPSAFCAMTHVGCRIRLPDNAINLTGTTLQIRKKDIPFLADRVVDAAQETSRSLEYNERPT